MFQIDEDTDHATLAELAEVAIVLRSLPDSMPVSDEARVKMEKAAGAIERFLEMAGPAVIEIEDAFAELNPVLEVEQLLHDIPALPDIGH